MLSDRKFTELFKKIDLLSVTITTIRCEKTKKIADSDTVSTYQFSLVQLVTDKKLEAFNKA